MEWKSLVPELVVSNFETSLHFYVEVLGFEIQYRRRDPAFAYLEREGSQLMIEVLQQDSWVVGELLHPFGRGLNLQIECSDVRALRERVRIAGLKPYKELAEAWYEAGDRSVGQVQFVVADPDGYLLRFCEVIGDR